ncbi:MAG: addiction module toxin, HicA family [Nitrospirae bacterium]|nr:addiction module toxin, HicA family [Nitrospirota bacterium]
MKRRKLLKHLHDNGAALIREGRKHSIFQKDGKKTQVPRHSEIVEELAYKICKDLDIVIIRSNS